MTSAYTYEIPKLRNYEILEADLERRQDREEQHRQDADDSDDDPEDFEFFVVIHKH